MGVTVTGLLLPRVVDPDDETDAAKAFAAKLLLGALDRCCHSTARPLGRLAGFRNRRRCHGQLDNHACCDESQDIEYSQSTIDAEPRR